MTAPIRLARGLTFAMAFLLRYISIWTNGSRMQINMTTFAARRRHYLHQTLQSLFASDWAETNASLNLIMGSSDHSHLGDYAHHPAIRIVPWDIASLPNLRSNCTLNKIRALRWGDDDTLLICEDDILFRPNWLAALKPAIEEMGTADYVLSLIAGKKVLERSRFVKGKLWVKRYPTFTLTGAQALFYPSKAIRRRVADYLEQHMGRGCGDHLIGQYARSYAALYATKEMLVKHAGGVSCFAMERREDFP